MTYVVEDGSGLNNANSYATVAYADEYFSTRAITAWTGTDDVKQAALVRATDYIEERWGTRFKGLPAFYTGDPATDQALSFPRVYLGPIPPVDPTVALPAQLLKATCEYALRALTASLLPDPVVDASGAMVTSKTQTVGPISRTTQFYASGGIQITQPYPAADLLLKPLVEQGGRAIRG